MQIVPILELSGAPILSPLHRSRPNSAHKSSPRVYTYVPNLVPMGLFSCPWDAENCQFCRILNVHMFWWRHLAENRESRTRVHNYKPSPSQRHQRYLDEVVSTNYVVQQRDGPTNKQKTQHFSPQRCAKSEPHQTWHGDRGPRHVLAPLKRFAIRRTVSPLGVAENLGTGPPQL